MPISLDLKDLSVLVVGASSGIGRSLALAASRAGARVALAARREDLLRDIAAEATGETAPIRCDVRSRADCDRAIEAVRSSFVGLDALIFCSGMSPLRMLEDASEEEWRDVLETNTVGASLITAAALIELRRRSGRAIYLSSYAVRAPLAGLGLYRVSKVALDALIECWRKEHPDIPFTRVVVGNTVGTEFANGWSPEALERAFERWTRESSLPDSLMQQEDVVEAVLSVVAARGYVDDIAIVPPPQPRSESGE